MSLRIPLLRAAANPEGDRMAIIDIGSNSIRLVVYQGTGRAPLILFNEKVMAGLGRGMAETGRLDPEAVLRAESALTRFHAILIDMGVARVRTVATAAARDAANGQEFLDRVARIGLEVELLSGEQEAQMAALGTFAGIPDADGIVGDLGGGSLELVRVSKGQVRDRVSFPLGVLRIAAIRAKGRGALTRRLTNLMARSGWGKPDKGLPLYLVGGSWRAVARFHMYQADWPLPIVHQYTMPAGAAQTLVRTLSHLDPKKLREVPGISSTRAANLLDAASLLSALVGRLQSSELIVSSYGVREGLLYDLLSPEVRATDPLICAAREEGARQGRFPEHGDLVADWIAPMFTAEGPADARLRHAVALLADVGWRAHPDLRAERGLDIALRGNWVGVDARGRAMMGHALWVSFGGTGVDPIVVRLCTPADLAQAERWGNALRVAQRLSGGSAPTLQASAVVVQGDTLELRLQPDHATLYGEVVERRHKRLAQSLGLRARCVTV
ncbi:Ppx/GppA family phosphatase [Sphingomonas sp. ID0503]|uniref:Ppx/GppA phosphatase family protein n=1 Tax=Sphingomonas sp. ID0503 TaxID=3399691 RepID=UPI003AFB484D